jgi:putative colanic acid biosynthesis acetyltransferase WcaF
MSIPDTYTSASFPLKNRLARCLWNMVSRCFFATSPRPFHCWRAFLLRLFGAKIGAGAHIYSGVGIWAPWNLKVGEESGIGDGAIIYSQGLITIGRRVVISQGVHLCAGTQDYTLRGFPLVTKPINIGSESWLAAEAFIHPRRYSRRGLCSRCQSCG